MKFTYLTISPPKTYVFLGEAEDMREEDRKAASNATAHVEITVVNSLTCGFRIMLWTAVYSMCFSSFSPLHFGVTPGSPGRPQPGLLGRRLAALRPCRCV